MKKLPEELRKEIQEHFLETMSVKDVVDKYGICKYTIYNIINEIRDKYEAVCPNCGKAFAFTHGKIYCSADCQHYQGELRKSNPAMEKITKPVIRLKQTKTVKKSKVSQKTLTELAIEAREHGMSYGKYVAMLEYQEKQKKKK